MEYYEEAKVLELPRLLIWLGNNDALGHAKNSYAWQCLVAANKGREPALISKGPPITPVEVILSMLCGV